MQWIGGHGNPKKAFSGLVEGVTIHAISDGTWSLTDGLCEILCIVGECDLAVSTWTAAQADLKRAERLLASREIRLLRLMVDRSFQTRQPGYCALARSLFGDDAIRVWSSHAKFAVFSGGKFDVLYLTSANMNQNKRLENLRRRALRACIEAYFAISGPLLPDGLLRIAGRSIADCRTVYCGLPDGLLRVQVEPKPVRKRHRLRPTGSVWTASHYIKVMMDGIFGHSNFRSEIIWKRTSAHSAAHRFGPVHDVLLFFTKSDKFTWNPGGPLVSVRGLYESDESVIRRPLLKS